MDVIIGQRVLTKKKILSTKVAAAPAHDESRQAAAVSLEGWV